MAINYIKEIVLDLDSNNAYTTVSAKQHDSARFLKIYLTKNNIPYQIDPTHSFYFRMRKPDGHAIINPAFVELNENSINVNEGSVVIQLTEQCLAAAGRGYADLVEYDENGNVLSSMPFILNVMSSPSLGDEIVSNSEFTQLSQLMADTEALLQNAPRINPDNKHWERYDNDETTFIDTGVVAEGINGTPGVDGNSVYFVAAEQGTDFVWNTALVVLPGTNYYASLDFTSEPVGTLDKITMVSQTYISGQVVYKIILDDNDYYVQTEDVVSSDEKTQYYHLVIPAGEQGEQGPQGERGERGAAGAGGVTWVDGIESKSERMITSPEIKTLGQVVWESSSENEREGLYNCYWEGVVSSPDNPNSFSLDDASNFKNIIFTELDDQSQEGESTNLYSVYEWLWEPGENGSTKVIGVIIRALESPGFVAQDNIEISGQTGIDSGNVHLNAVSYVPQSSFLERDEIGNERTILITDDMRAAARANINAMENMLGENGDVVAYNQQWKAIKPHTLLNRLNYYDLQQIIQNYQYEEIEG